MRFGFLKVLSAAMVTGLAASPALAVTEVPLERDFGGVEMTVKPLGSYVVVVAARNLGGKVGVCGTIWFNRGGGTLRHVEPKITDSYRFSIDGVPLKVNSRRFKRHDSEEAAVAYGKAQCSVTKTPWSDSFTGKPVTMEQGLRRVTD